MRIQPFFSFIIVNFNSARLLPACLQSVEQLNLPSKDYEIRIINNDPNEVSDLEKLQETHTFFLIHTRKNIGFGAANNQAARLARGNILIFLNPDTVVLKMDIERIARHFETFPHCGILGFRLLLPDGGIQPWSTGTEVTLWDIIRNNLGFPASRALWRNENVASVAWVSGGAFAIPRKVFKLVRGFDEEFFLYFEDVDLCRRVRERGYEVTLFPEIQVLHEGGRSSASSRQQKRSFYRSQDLYFYKHRPFYERILVRFLRRLTHF